MSEENMEKGEQIYLDVMDNNYVIETADEAELAIQYCLLTNQGSSTDLTVTISISGDAVGMIRNLILESICNSKERR